jgi:hypothetical protein
MAEEQVFVSHAPADSDLVEDLFSTVRNLPISVHVALEAVEPGRSRRNLEGRLANSDVLVAVLTADSEYDQWVNQEVGYAIAKGIPVLPLSAESISTKGFIEDHERVRLEPEERDVTAFNLLCRLRSELQPLGSLSTPNWFVRFPCTFDDCGTPVTLSIEETQKSLWQMYKHNQALVANCEECGSRYFFNPATLGYVQRKDPA